VGLQLNLDGEELRGFQLYRILARNFLSGDGLYFHFYFDLGDRWANRPPLYPLFLAGIRVLTDDSSLAILLIQAVLGSLTAVLAGRLAADAGGRRAGILAGLMMALYPYAVGNDTTLVEQPLYVFLVILFCLALLRGRDRVRIAPGSWWRSALLCGALGGLAALTRETFNPFLALVFLWVLLGWRSPDIRRRLAWCVLTGVAFLVVCSPWLIRNAVRFGVPMFAFAAGKSLWVGNNADTFARYPADSIDESENIAWRNMGEEDRRRVMAHRDDERLQDGVFQDIAVRYIEAHPGEFFRRGIRKIVALYSIRLVPGTRRRLKEIGYSASYGPVFLLALAGILVLSRRWRPLLIVTGMALLSVTILAFFFWGQTRLRATYDVFLVILAAGVLDRAWGALGRRRLTGSPPRVSRPGS
jgi:4-amino-4-deoxy-L-arabinose transferase-like glycosyltransferase